VGEREEDAVHDERRRIEAREPEQRRARDGAGAAREHRQAHDDVRRDDERGGHGAVQEHVAAHRIAAHRPPARRPHDRRDRERPHREEPAVAAEERRVAAERRALDRVLDDSRECGERPEAEDERARSSHCAVSPTRRART
jgi:hypothetical protein